MTTDRKSTPQACRFHGTRYGIPSDRIDYHDACYALIEGYHGPGVRSLVALAIRSTRKAYGNAAAIAELRHLRSIQGAIPVWGGASGTTLVKA